MTIKSLVTFGIVLSACSALFPIQIANARPTQEEISTFLSAQRKEQESFERSLLADSSSLEAATQEFNRQTISERSKFMKSLRDVPGNQRSQLLSEFNAKARKNQKTFQENIPKISKGKYEKLLDDFDKKVAQDRKALNEQLSQSDPGTRKQTIEQFINSTNLERAKIQNSILKDSMKRQRDFKDSQVKKSKDFFGN